MINRKKINNYNNKIIGLTNGIFILGTKHNLKVHKGNCCIVNGKIVDFDLNNDKFDEVIDLNGALVTPMLHNAHLHLGESLYSGLQGKWDLDSYLKFTEYWTSALAERKSDAWNYSAKVTLSEVIQSGTGSVCCARGWELLKDTGIKALSGYPIMESKKLHEFISKGIEGYRKFANDVTGSNVKPGVFLHSLYYNTRAGLDLAKSCIQEGASFLTTHVAETPESEQKVKDIWNRNSIQILAENNLLNSNTLLVHGGFLTTDDLKLLSKYSANIVICPISNIKLGSKYLDPSILDKYNVNWCIATDGAGTGYTLNLFKHAKLCRKILKLDNLTIWDSITNKPAKFMGFHSSGYIDKMQDADLAIFRGCEYTDINDILDWLFEYDYQTPCKVMVNGNFISPINFTQTDIYSPKKPLRIDSIKKFINI